MGHDHSHAVSGAGNEKRLFIALGLTGSFMVAEIAGGIVFNSLALLSDAAHMFTDVTALAISLVAIRVGKRAVDNRRSYGYQRFEILAAAFNAILLFGVAGYILFEAYQRFAHPPEVAIGGMLAVAVAGLLINFIAMRLLSSGKEDSLNMKGAYLEVWSDMLGSVGVIVAALVIRFTGWAWVDSLVAVGIGLWVLPRTWVLLKASTHILLQGTPAEVDLEALRKAILANPGVTGMHDLHVWTITSGRHVLTAHVIVSAGTDRQVVLEQLATLLTEKFKLAHTTLQLEDEACGDLHASLDDASHPEPDHDGAGQQDDEPGNKHSH